LQTTHDSHLEQILDQLGSGEGLPAAAIRAADANRAAMVPLLLRAIDQTATADRPSRNTPLIAFHLLGQWREKSAYRSLAAFLRRSPDEIGPLLGDATTETSHRVMAAVFDGDPNPLYEVILDPDADEFIRARMFDALVIVTLRGELPREETARFLQSCYASLQPQGECYAWEGWQGAIAILGLSGLEPLVEQAFERGFIDSSWLGFEHFEENLQRAIDGEPQSWQDTDEYEPFGDTIEELSGWVAFAPKREKAQRSEAAWNSRLWAPSVPAVNPFKAVGRNDPCPCGSGKKFKKCCLDSVRQDASPSVLHRIDPDLQWSQGAESAIGRLNEEIRSYDPLTEPNPQQWLALDEQQRIDQVAAYHRRAGLGGPRAAAHAAIHVIVENQIADDELPVRRTAERLMSEGLDRHDAIHAIGSVLIVNISDRVHDAELGGETKSDQDQNKAYFDELERLTADAWLRSA
jgi:uncharacterized protein YchJ